MRIPSLRRPALGVLAVTCSVALLPDLAFPKGARAEDATELDRMLITAQGRDEPRARAAGTVQVIDTATLRRSSARSVTDLLAENAVGFFSDWSPGQTSFNIRGGATDGQGRDWRSQVTVLMNGRRAGTANLSKLSPDDLDRIEIIRGPASVIYGAQAIGGVINLVTRSGATEDAGSEITARAGSFGLARGHAANAGGMAGFDHYIGIGGGVSDDYHTPEGQLANTAWKRGGGLAALGFENEDVGRIDLTLRTDGVYDAGFRGSQWDVDNTDDRRNASLDLAWDTEFGGGLGLAAQAYAVRDVDSFHWGSERQRSGAPGFSVDDNRRQLDVLGLKLAPRLAVDDDTDLLFGIDAETAKLRSDRFRQSVSGGTTSQVPPYDINQDTEDFGVYGEGVHRAFDDALTLRGGARWTYGRVSTRATPNQPLLVERTESWDDVTWSVGAAWAAWPTVTLRAGVATGFRAPTGTELAADFTAVGGGRTFGNPDLDPERSLQYEIGAAHADGPLFLDLALFQNTITDRITTVTTGPNEQTYANSAGDAVIRGLELQAAYDIARRLGWDGWTLVARGSGVWNFEMRDKGADAALTGPYTDKLQRMHETQAALGITTGQPGVWSLTTTAVFRGPLYYDTEESLVAGAEPDSRYVHRKGSSWLMNLRGDWFVTETLTLFAGVDNLFDVNDHPLFIATDTVPSLGDPVSSNGGGTGNSQAGRAAYIGLTYRF